MTRWLRYTSYLKGLSLHLLVTGAGAHGSQSTAITIDPGQYAHQLENQSNNMIRY